MKWGRFRLSYHILILGDISIYGWPIHPTQILGQKKTEFHDAPRFDVALIRIVWWKKNMFAKYSG